MTAKSGLLENTRAAAVQ